MGAYNTLFTMIVISILLIGVAISQDYDSVKLNDEEKTKVLREQFNIDFFSGEFELSDFEIAKEKTSENIFLIVTKSGSKKKIDISNIEKSARIEFPYGGIIQQNKDYNNDDFKATTQKTFFIKKDQKVLIEESRIKNLNEVLLEKAVIDNYEISGSNEHGFSMSIGFEGTGSFYGEEMNINAEKGITINKESRFFGYAKGDITLKTRNFVPDEDYFSLELSSMKDGEEAYFMNSQGTKFITHSEYSGLDISNNLDNEIATVIFSDDKLIIKNVKDLEIETKDGVYNEIISSNFFGVSDNLKIKISRNENEILLDLSNGMPILKGDVSNLKTNIAAMVEKNSKGEQTPFVIYNGKVIDKSVLGTITKQGLFDSLARIEDYNLQDLVFSSFPIMADDLFNLIDDETFQENPLLRKNLIEKIVYEYDNKEKLNTFLKKLDSKDQEYFASVYLSSNQINDLNGLRTLLGSQENQLLRRSAIDSFKPQIVSSQSTDDLKLLLGFSNLNSDELNALLPKLIVRSAKPRYAIPTAFVEQERILKIYNDPYFQEKLNNLKGDEAWSIATSISTNLDRENSVLNSNNIREAFDTVYSFRSDPDIRNREIIGPSTQTFIPITHEDTKLFDEASLIQLAEDSGFKGEIVKGLRGSESYDRILKSIAESKGKTTIYFNNHGSDYGQHLSDSYELKSHIGYLSLGDSLIQRAKNGEDLTNVNIVFESCYSYDFAENLYSYLNQQGKDVIKNMPTIVTVTNRGQLNVVGQYFGLGRGADAKSPFQQTFYQKEPGKPYTIGTLFDNERIPLRHEDPAVFVPYNGKLKTIGSSNDDFQKVKPEESKKKTPGYIQIGYSLEEFENQYV